MRLLIGLGSLLLLLPQLSAAQQKIESSGKEIELIASTEEVAQCSLKDEASGEIKESFSSELLGGKSERYNPCYPCKHGSISATCDIKVYDRANPDTKWAIYHGLSCTVECHVGNVGDDVTINIIDGCLQLCDKEGIDRKFCSCSVDKFTK